MRCFAIWRQIRRHLHSGILEAIQEDREDVRMIREAGLLGSMRPTWEVQTSALILGMAVRELLVGRAPRADMRTREEIEELSARLECPFQIHCGPWPGHARRRMRGEVTLQKVGTT